MRTETVCAVVLAAILAPVAWGQAPEGDGEKTSGSGPAVEALNSGRRAKGEGKIALAEVHFQEALSDAERDGDVYKSALEELTYHLPLMRVERYVVSEQWKQAEQLLQDLLQRHQEDEEKSQHLVQLIAKLRNQDRDTDESRRVYTQPGSGRKAIEQIQQVLERFLAEHGRYPRGYPELNEVLPAGRYPLEDYDIVHYVGRGDAYGLTLRSRKDPANLLSVQKTGLVE